MKTELKVKGLIASCKNLIGAIENKQWERLDKKVVNLKEAISIVEGTFVAPECTCLNSFGEDENCPSCYP